MASGLLNMMLAMGLVVFFLLFPEKIQLFLIFNIKTLNIDTVKIIGSGLFSLIMLLIQIVILIIIYRRSKDPENYHLNFFGKKVFHNGLVKSLEVTVFLACAPCFLFSGAYFAAKIITNFFGN